MRAWLFTLMHNLFVNQAKAARSRTLCEIDARADLPVSGRQLETLGVRDSHDALRQLPTKQQEVILLIGLEQFGYAEAANILGVPVGTVMSRLSRGREKLHQLLESDVAKLKIVK